MSMMSNSPVYKMPRIDWGPDIENADFLDKLSVDLGIVACVIAYFSVLWWML